VYSWIGGGMKEKIVEYLKNGFIKSLENARHAVGNKESAYLWALRHYDKLSKKEKQEILKKIKS
tara:strand:- start:127 stop:318 length:192 start_codon:yes stop_codon:yes gene_type:complete